MTRKNAIQAKDIMQKDVLKLDAAMPIERAIEALEEHEISGAPVVDPSNQLVGVLTTADVTRSEHVRAGRLDARREEWALSEPSSQEAEDDERNEDVIFGMEDYSPAVRGAATVGDWMNRGAVTVDPDASLVQVCRSMIKHQIHRVLVARGKKIEGIITSFDVVRWVAEGN